MRFYFPDTPEIPLPPGHRFPRGKYKLLRDKIDRDGILSGATLEPSLPARLEDIRQAHLPYYVIQIMCGHDLGEAAQRQIGFPWSRQLGIRARAVVGGALCAARAALETGLSGQLAGGTHHAHRDFGTGFCVFNDLAVVTRTLLAEGLVGRIAIVDLDVHQGDGTAAILAREPRAFVLSVHGEKNYPFRKRSSTLDVALPDGTEDAAYLAALAPALEQVEAFRPQLILYLSGADPLASDRLGRLSLTFAGLIERDRMVFDLARRLGVPISIAIGGGYAEPIEESVEVYANTFRIGRDVLRL